MKNRKIYYGKNLSRRERKQLEEKELWSLLPNKYNYIDMNNHIKKLLTKKYSFESVRFWNIYRKLNKKMKKHLLNSKLNVNVF